jgi:hypothetical protein
MSRRRLPDRRDGEIHRAAWHSSASGAPVEIDVQVSWYPDGQTGEVFASLVGLKEGAALQFIIEDGCWLASRLRQHGVGFVEQALGLGGPPGEPAASPLAAIVRAAAAIEAGVDSWDQVRAAQGGP